MGVGKALMSSLETAAQEAGCTKIEITSGTQRDGAHAFYTRLGYSEKPKRFLKSLRD
jgi:GNAT superfamily N-acetyltransferase